MRKLVAVILAAACMFAAWKAGTLYGVSHAVTDSEVWLNEYTVPEDGNGDLIVNITVDGKTYENVLWIY